MTASAPRTAVGIAHARAGLMGNPSDVYEGKAIAIIVRNFAARVTLTAADRFEILSGPSDALAFPGWSDAAAHVEREGIYGGIRLLKAAMKRFQAKADPGRTADPALQRFTMRYESDIPRQVGMSGSSAIVIASLRALMTWFGVEIPPHELADMALAAEVEELGITAGPMDRVIQSYEGVVHMDFKPPRTAASYTRLDSKRLPPLFIAYDPRVGEVSGKVHNDVRQRWLRGDPDVREAISIFPRLVDEAMGCLDRGDLAGFRRCMDENFDTRAKIWRLSERDHEMVRTGRELGAAVKFCGSGGAVIGAMPEESLYPALAEAYGARGYKIIRPEIEPPGVQTPTTRTA